MTHITGELGLPFSVSYFPVTVIKHLSQGHLKTGGLVVGFQFQRITNRVEKLGSGQPWPEQQAEAHILNQKQEAETAN